jgi:hypothetical protein
MNQTHNTSRNSSRNSGQNPLSNEAWEELIRHTASALPYPSTPDVAEQVATRLASERSRGAMHALRPIWVVAIILALLIGLWAVPPVRAAILEFLQIGAVRIWLVEPTPASPTIPATAPPGRATSTSFEVGPQNTPRPTPTAHSYLNLAGPTTLAEAEARAGFAIRLPTYPADLGSPDAVFYQDIEGALIVMVWTKADDPNQVEYSLHILSNSGFAYKSNPPVVMTTTVEGNLAAWTHGPYLMAYGRGSEPGWELRYLVSGRVLIWEENGLTYRLESDLTLEEAVRMAESLE